MTVTLERRPRFLSLLLGEIREDVDRDGVRALIPWWMISFAALGAVAAWRTPADFFADWSWSVSVTFYGALLTFNGLLLALSWQAFSRIQSSICSPGFSSFLRQKNLLSGYLFFIDYIHLAQVFAVVASALGLAAILITDLPILVQRVLFGAALGTSAYAVKQAFGAVRLMHDLVWYHAAYDEAAAEASGNITPFTAGGRRG